MAVSALLAIAAFSPLALGLPSPAPTSAAHNPRWKRDLQERLARNPRGFTDDDGVAHLPIYRRGGGSSAVQSPKWSRSAAKAKRQGSTIVQTGLGDYIDLTYQVSLEIGGSAAYFQVGECSCISHRLGRCGLLFLSTRHRLKRPLGRHI